MPQCPIFVSYSHKDNREKDKLLTQLGVLQNADLIDVWSDSRIQAGEDWRRAIEQAMSAAKVAILFISANYLNSPFIKQEEIPTLLKRREREGLIIFPVIARPCAWEENSWLAEMEVRPRDGTPIWGSNRSKVDERLKAIAEEIAALFKVSPGALDSRSTRSDSSSAVRLNLDRWADQAEMTSNPRENPSMLLDRVLAGSSPTEGDGPFHAIEYLLRASRDTVFDVEVFSGQPHLTDKVSSVEDFWKILITSLALNVTRSGPRKWLITETVKAIRENSLDARPLIDAVWKHICQRYCDHASPHYREEVSNLIVSSVIESSRERSRWDNDLLYRFIEYLHEKLEADPTSVRRIAEQLQRFDQELGNDAPPRYLKSLKVLISEGRAKAMLGTRDIPQFETKLATISGSTLCDYQFEAMVFPLTVQDYLSLRRVLPEQPGDKLLYPHVFKIVSEDAHELYNLLASEVLTLIDLVVRGEPDVLFTWDVPTACEWLALAGCEDQSFPWGNDPPTNLRANLDFGAESQLSPVGTRPRGASKYQVQDCCGNVHEIVRISRYDAFPSDFRLAGGCYQTNAGVADCQTFRPFRRKREDNRRNTAVRLIRYRTSDEEKRYKALRGFLSVKGIDEDVRHED